MNDNNPMYLLFPAIMLGAILAIILCSVFSSKDANAKRKWAIETKQVGKYLYKFKDRVNSTDLVCYVFTNSWAGGLSCVKLK